ncbi:MAG: hypothetical protein ACJAUR_002092, partial [Ulvibacter sp.]
EHIKKNIEFVIEAIDFLDITDLVNFKGEIRILEKEDHYDISVSLAPYVLFSKR